MFMPRRGLMFTSGMTLLPMDYITEGNKRKEKEIK
jgi:hypothetical protein